MEWLWAIPTAAVWYGVGYWLARILSDRINRKCYSGYPELPLGEEQRDQAFMRGMAFCGPFVVAGFLVL